MNFARVVKLQDPDVDAIASFIFIAAIELVCGFGADDATVASLAQTAAWCFLALAALLVWSTARFDRGSQREYAMRDDAGRASA